MLLEPHRRLADELREAEIDVRYVEYNGGHDDACWSGGIADGLTSIVE